MLARLRMAGLAGALLLASAAASAVQPVADSQPADILNQTPDGPIVWQSRPQWLPSLLVRRVETSVCPGNRIEIEIDYLRPRELHRWISRVTRIRINGNAVSQERLDSLNNVLQSFDIPPLFDPSCLGNYVSLGLLQVQHGPPSRTEYFALVGAPR